MGQHDPRDQRGNDELDQEPKGARTEEGATPGDIGSLDGAAAAGSRGATEPQSDDDDGVVPRSAPDPSVGPD